MPIIPLVFVYSLVLMLTNTPSLAQGTSSQGPSSQEISFMCSQLTSEFAESEEGSFTSADGHLRVDKSFGKVRIIVGGLTLVEREDFTITSYNQCLADLWEISKKYEKSESQLQQQKYKDDILFSCVSSEKNHFVERHFNLERLTDEVTLRKPQLNRSSVRSELEELKNSTFIDGLTKAIKFVSSEVFIGQSGSEYRLSLSGDYILIAERSREEILASIENFSPSFQFLDENFSIFVLLDFSQIQQEDTTINTLLWVDHQHILNYYAEVRTKLKDLETDFEADIWVHIGRCTPIT